MGSRAYSGAAGKQLGLGSQRHWEASLGLESQTLGSWPLGLFLPVDTLAGIAFLQFLVVKLPCLQQIPRERSGFGRVLLLLVLVVLGFLEATLFLPVSTVTKTLITNQ